MWNKNKKPNIQGIQNEIDNNFLDLTSGVRDVYEFCGYIGDKYYKSVDPHWGKRTEADPYTDLTFALLEINGIELY